MKNLTNITRAKIKTMPERILGKFTDILPSKLTGSAEAMDQRYRTAFGAGPEGAIIRSVKTSNAQKYLLILLLFVCGILTVLTEFLGGNARTAEAIVRDEYGGNEKVIETQLEAEFKGEIVKRDIVLKVSPKQPESAVIADEIEALKARLPALILGDNADMSHITKDLTLISADPDTGIAIDWKSADERVIDNTGKINYVEARKDAVIDLTARLQKGEASENFVMTVMIGDTDSVVAEDERGYEASITRSLDALIHDLEKNRDGDIVLLPEETASGIHLRWKTPKMMAVIVVPFAALLLGVLVYRKRYARIEAEIKRCREGMHRDFPEFLAKLLLLLNAGLVITSAVDKTAADYERRKRPGKHSYFFEELLRMRSHMESSNASLSTEFADLARRSGQKELMRFSAILGENIDKGNELSEKLEQESNMLWEVRKKEAEKQGRLAETRLTFPMALQLLTIMLVTVTPAIMNMG
ncbi:MAG: type II secretion system F family protein [Clostridiales Family XIII bacterium]|jgi:hypothetical protein|nr:type II secretion system F family protein [Clostridiales Family XIII bacterium]